MAHPKIRVKRVALERQRQHVPRTPLAPHELAAVDAFLDAAKRQGAMRRAAHKAAPRPISLAPCAFLTRPVPDDRWSDWSPDHDEGGASND